MGMFDSVMVPCPSCDTVIEFQSKAGDCFLRTFTLDTAPAVILADLASDPPETCPHCQTSVRVEMHQRTVGKAVPGLLTSDSAHLRNLLARIHRDGGHYLEEHGMDKAVADADLIIARLHAKNDE